MKQMSVVAVASAVTVALAAGIAFATIPDSEGEIHGCYHKQTGNLRVVENDDQCGQAENSISWSQTGPTGAPGPGFEFVNVLPDGTLSTQSSGSGVVGASRTEPGVYHVEYDHDLAFCARFVVFNVFPRMYTAGQQAIDPDPPTLQRRMIVRTFAPSGALEDAGFTLYTQCP